MRNATKMAGFSKKPAEEQSRILRDMVHATRGAPNGELTAVDSQIKGYEVEHGFDSNSMRARVSAGQLRESEVICQWLMALKLRERLVRRAP